MTRSRNNLYQRSDTGMLRAALSPTAPVLAPWPAPDSDAEQWRAWLAVAWADGSFSHAVTAASPDLARQVAAVLSEQITCHRRARRAALAVGRYAIRYAGRSTPFGRFAGVALVEFGSATRVRFGQRHQAVLRTEPVSLAQAVAGFEADPEFMDDIEVCLNNLATVRGGRVFVPAEGPDEHSLALTPAVAFVMEVAKEPITHGELLNKLAADFPGTPAEGRSSAVAALLRVGLLRSALRAPATVVDPGEALPAGDARLAMLQVSRSTDMRLDVDVTLPLPIGVEMETAATLLAKLAFYPSGTPAWNLYTQRFAERYGQDTLVAVPLLIDPDRGMGLPDGFGTLSMPPRPMSKRDRVLLELAGTAALEGSRSVTLTVAMIEEIQAAAGPAPNHVAPHLEVCAQVQAVSAEAVDRGAFRLRIHTVSRAGGSMSGRFWHLFGDDPRLAYNELPTVEPDVLTAQLSFHPSRMRADLLTRAPQILPTVVSVGEFRRPGEGVLGPEDLAVGFDGDRLFLALASTGQHIELLAPTAINFIWNNHTPPLARFLAEIARAACPQVTGFDWGAGLVLPFTPELRHRRIILMPARWRLQARDLPRHRATLGEWADSLHRWRERLRMPSRVLLSVDDQHLPLDLDQDMHADILRTHLTGTGTANLSEAPPADADGWIGGRAHSIVVTMGARP